MSHEEKCKCRVNSQIECCYNRFSMTRDYSYLENSLDR